MKLAELKLLDIMADEDTEVQIEIQERPSGKVIYVHVDDMTVLRICRVQTKVDIV